MAGAQAKGLQTLWKNTLGGGVFPLSNRVASTPTQMSSTAVKSGKRKYLFQQQHITDLRNSLPQCIGRSTSPDWIEERIGQIHGGQVFQ